MCRDHRLRVSRSQFAYGDTRSEPRTSPRGPTCAHPTPASADSPRPAAQPAHSVGAVTVSVRSGSVVGASPEPVRPGCPPSLRSFERSRYERSARRFALAAIESADGGCDELVESRPSRASSSAIRPWAHSSCEVNSTTSPASSSQEGCGCSGADTTQMIDDQGPEIKPTRRHAPRDQTRLNGPAQPAP